MIQHFMDKWDSYLSVLLGVLLIVAVKFTYPVVALYFKYYVFLMIAVVIFDTLINFTQHESFMWKFAAIFSNAIVLVSCVYILHGIYKLVPFKLPEFTFMLGPNFMLYLGIFLIVENLMWIFIYDHF